MKIEIGTYVQAPINIPRLESIGPGDEDVFSKPGRTTRTRVMSFDPTFDTSHTQLYLTVVYEVEESRHDFTHLRGQITVKMEAENGSRIVRLGNNGKNANYYREFGGEDHEWHNITDDPGIQGTYFSNLQIRFDGSGDDDRGNAQLQGFLSVPVIVEVEMGEPSIAPLPPIFKATQLARQPFLLSLT